MVRRPRSGRLEPWGRGHDDEARPPRPSRRSAPGARCAAPQDEECGVAGSKLTSYRSRISSFSLSCPYPGLTSVGSLPLSLSCLIAWAIFLNSPIRPARPATGPAIWPSRTTSSPRGSRRAAVPTPSGRFSLTAFQLLPPRSLSSAPTLRAPSPAALAMLLSRTPCTVAAMKLRTTSSLSAISLTRTMEVRAAAMSGSASVRAAAASAGARRIRRPMPGEGYLGSDGGEALGTASRSSAPARPRSRGGWDRSPTDRAASARHR